MRMQRFAILVPFLLAGCAAPAVISDINDSSLKVQANAYTSINEVNAKAREGCSLYSKTPVAISTQCLDGYCIRKKYLYACK